MAIATDEFEGLARQAARAIGLPEARIASVAHPVGGVSEATLDGRADAIVDSVLALFCGRRA